MVHTVHDNTRCTPSSKVNFVGENSNITHQLSARLFIVEDEVLVLRELENTLHTLGYRVVGSACSAVEALDSIATAQPDLVLMDIYLPGEIDGIDATRLIADLYEIPVIYLTAHSDPQTWQRAKKTQPFGFLIKPWTTEELVANIDIAISRHQSELKMRHALDIAMRERKTIEASNKTYCHSLSMTTHELKNFLSVVTTTSELLQSDRSRVSEQQRQRLLHNVQRAVHDMDQLLDDLGVLTSPIGQRSIVQPQMVNLLTLCQNLMDASRLVDQSRHLLSLQCDHASVDVFLDPHLLSHIIRNLLSNALKYSMAGTTVSLRLSVRSNYVQLCVEDEGMGIPEDFIPHLFEMFQRGQNVQHIGGSGIGLALVKRCVELQQGTVSVQSQIGHGTIFTVLLPYALQR